MADTNAPAKSLLLDTQLIVTNKFTVFASDATVDKTKLTALQKKADEHIELFKQPEVWLKQVTIDSAAEADRIFSMLMGDEVAPRREFIESHAKYAKIDV